MTCLNKEQMELKVAAEMQQKCDRKLLRSGVIIIYIIVGTVLQQSL